MTVGVVGAGPAGCAAAWRLGALGLDVVLYEKGAPGKDKPCGDAYLPEAVAHLADMGIAFGGGSVPGARRFDAVSLWWDRTPVWRAPLGGSGWVARRATVDQLMRDRVAVRANVRYRARVMGFRAVARGWELTVADGSGPRTTTHEAVVVSTGAGARIPGLVGLPPDADLGVSYSCYATGADVETVDFVFGAAPYPGYAWLFPLGDGAVNVGVFGMAGNGGHAGLLAEFLRARGLRPLGRARGGAGRMWSGRQSRWHLPGVVACGDAAGLVDPLSGEGIGPAMSSGIRAANAVAGYLAGHADALELYSRRLASDAQRRFAMTPSRRVWARLASVTDAA